MKTIITKRYTYGLIYKISRSGFVLFAFLSAVIGLFLTIGSISLLISGHEFDSSSLMTIFYNIFGVAVWSPIFFLFSAYLMTDITIENDGIDVIFLWKTYQIKWGEIIEIKPIRPFGLFTNKNSKVIVVNSKLTFIHHLYGMIYAGKYQPAILIHRYISDYDLLLKNISMQTKNNFANPVSQT